MLNIRILNVRTLNIETLKPYNTRKILEKLNTELKHWILEH